MKLSKFPLACAFLSYDSFWAHNRLIEEPGNWQGEDMTFEAYFALNSTRIRLGIPSTRD